MRLLHRLAGLETEYVARFRPDTPRAKRPLTFDLLFLLAAELKRRLPLVPADYPKKGFFLATGGAFWHERPGEGLDHPLIEGSTPECRGALQLLACQRAQDMLLSSAARDVGGGDFTLCKSDCDANGNVYGSQENYDAILAHGWRLRAWRIAVVILLLPLMAVGWIALMPIVMGLAAYYAAASVVFLLYLLTAAPLSAIWRVPDPKTVSLCLFGPWGGEPFRFMPTWISLIATALEHIVLSPAALALASLCWLLAYREVRRGLLPFLISRSIIAGNGHLCADGRFRIGSKAPGIKLVTGVGVFRIRSIFSFSPQFKGLTFFSIFNGRQFPSLLAERQRLQICLGDGNLCDEAEYLRIGTTMLVIDAIEAGHPIPIPALRRPISALRKIVSDPTLATRVRTCDGRSLSALEIQRIYLRACREFVAEQSDPPGEALDILDRWERVLDHLEADPNQLVGRLDWITKRWLIDQAGSGTSWESQKKIDLRYHELSPDGYFERLRSAGIVHAILTDDQINEAMASPPPGTPATKRGREIRRLSARPQSVRANWQTIAAGSPPKLIWLTENDDASPADRS